MEAASPSPSAKEWHDKAVEAEFGAEEEPGCGQGPQWGTRAGAVAACMGASRGGQCLLTTGCISPWNPSTK